MKLNSTQKIALFALCVGIIVLSACVSILPKETTVTKMPWQTFEEAQEAFNKISVGKTKKSELKELGFSPDSVPNVEVLDHVSIINRMSSIFNKDNLPEGINKCLQAKLRCQAYLMNIKNIKRDRIGNVLVDLFGFRKETKVTGWQLGTTIILVDETVVYKSWVGIADIEEYEKKIIPLGPLQNLGDLLTP